MDGYAFRPWLEYYIVLDFPTLSLLNFEFSLTKLDELQFKLGQWNLSRKVMNMSYGDLEKVQKAEGFVAFSAARNISA